MTPEEMKEIRTERGLTQASLAALFGLSDGRAVRRYESGAHRCSGPVWRLYELLKDERVAGWPHRKEK